MSQYDECGITLGLLPSDIIRRLLGNELETIESKRLISPHWNAVCLSIIRECKRLPAIKSLCWSKEVTAIGKPFPRLSITLAYRYLNYFGVGKWGISSHTFDNEVQVCSGSILEDIMFTSAGKARFMRFLNKCSSIDRLEFRNGILSSNKQMCIIKEILSTARIREVAFTDLPNFNPNTASQILSVLETIPFQRLLLTIGLGELYHTFNVLILNEKFLATALNLVSEVEISHPFIYSYAYLSHWKCWRDMMSKNQSVTAKYVADSGDNTQHFRMLVTARVPKNV